MHAGRKWLMGMALQKPLNTADIIGVARAINDLNEHRGMTSQGCGNSDTCMLCIRLEAIYKVDGKKVWLVMHLLYMKPSFCMSLKSQNKSSGSRSLMLYHAQGSSGLCMSIDHVVGRFAYRGTSGRQSRAHAGCSQQT